MDNMPKKHLAAASLSAGSALTIIERETPEPGPNEILLHVKAVALNPVDYYQRDHGFPPVPSYPAVFGSDVAGVVVKVGSDVANAPAAGSRVLALATSFYHEGSADHGAFQEYTLARMESVAEIPGYLSFEEAAQLPLAALTALSGLTTMGLSLDTRSAKKRKKAILIWGGSSSVGSLAVQTAKIMGFTVYATAGVNNLDYVKTLGAHAVFDYKSEDVVAQISDKIKQDGFTLHYAHVIVKDALQQVLDILKLTKNGEEAKVAHAPILPPDHPTLEGTEIKFTSPPADVGERNKHMVECFQVFLKGALVSRTIVPSPRLQMVQGGLSGLNEAMDNLKQGVSGTKLVVSL